MKKYKFNELDKIDISLYLIYEDTEKIMREIKNDYTEDIFQSITVKEFMKYIEDRYGI